MSLDKVSELVNCKVESFEPVKVTGPLPRFPEELMESVPSLSSVPP